MNDDLLLSDCHRSIRTSGWVGCGRGKDKLHPLLFSPRPADIMTKEDKHWDH